VSKRFEELARRKQGLIARCARERVELAAAWSRIRSPFDVGSMLFGLGRTLKAHPLIAAGISSLLVSGYGAKLMKQAGELLQLWRLARPLWSWWTKRRRTR
jgi:hypothetical protein